MAGEDPRGKPQPGEGIFRVPAQASAAGTGAKVQPGGSAEAGGATGIGGDGGDEGEAEGAGGEV